MGQYRNKQIKYDSDISFVGGNKLISNVADAVSSNDAVNLSQLTAVQSLIQNFEWRDSVLSIVDNTAVPPTEVLGDRYLLDATGGGVNAAWDGASANDIVTFDGASWVAYTPTVGAFVAADDEPTVLYQWGGSSWASKAFESTTASTGLVKSGFDIQLANANGNGIDITSGAISVDALDSTITVAAGGISVGTITTGNFADFAGDVETVVFTDANFVDSSTINFDVAAGASVSANIIADSIDESLIKGLGTGATGDVVKSDGLGGFEFGPDGTGLYEESTGTLSTIRTGQGHTASGNNATILGGDSNTASGACSVVVGGKNNTASSFYDSVLGGSGNVAKGLFSSIGGGFGNTASGGDSTISGGYQNQATAPRTTISGGGFNIASGDRSTISGGQQNTASGNDSSILGGFGNTADAYYSNILGGTGNNVAGYTGANIFGSNITANAVDTTFVNNFNIVDAPTVDNANDKVLVWNETTGQVEQRGATSIGVDAQIYIEGAGTNSVIKDGAGTASGNYNMVLGGTGNTSSGAYHSIILGGTGNSTSGAPFQTVLSGKDNSTVQFMGTVVSGQANTVSGAYSSILNGKDNAISASGTFSAILAGQNNIISGQDSVIVGGDGNVTTGAKSFIGNGFGSTAGTLGFIGTGDGNEASGNQSSIINGTNNVADGLYSTILGGTGNDAAGFTGANILGSNITANAADTTFVNNFNIVDAPTNDNANDTVLVLNTTTGQVETRDATTITPDTALTQKRATSASAVTSGNAQLSVTDVFGSDDPNANTIPQVFVNGQFANVTEDLLGDGYFGTTSAAAVAFNALDGTENFYWNGVIAGYDLDASDTVITHYSV